MGVNYPRDNSGMGFFIAVSHFVTIYIFYIMPDSVRLYYIMPDSVRLYFISGPIL